ncbi:MAG: N-acetylmuramoyl-L-alanine amidase [Vulcanimicrobiota bacterium]
MSRFSKPFLSIILTIFIFVSLFYISVPVMAETGPGTSVPEISEGENFDLTPISDKDEDKPENKQKEKKKVSDSSEPTQKPEEIKTEIQKDRAKQPVSTPLPGLEPEATRKGMVKDYALKYRDQLYKFKVNPVAFIEGEPYVCITDPVFKRLFHDMGITYSWFSYSNKLFIYMKNGSINWEVFKNHATVGDDQIMVPLAAHKNFSSAYIPLKSLAGLMNLELLHQKEKNLTLLRPAVSIAARNAEDENTIDLVLSAVTDIPYKVKYQASPPAIRLTFPRAGYTQNMIDKFNVEGVEVRVNNKVDAENLYVTLQFPPHWKGEIIPTSFDSQVVVRMKPNIVYAWGVEEQAIKSVDVTPSDNQLHLQFNTSDMVQYYWSYSPDEGILYIDVPFATIGQGINLNRTGSKLVKNCTVFNYKPDGINITRFRFELEPHTRFMIGPPEDQKGSAFALLLGSPDTIAQNQSSPLQGSSEIIIPGGKNSPLVVIDPGHGGSDPGACKFGFKEKDINLDISLKLAKALSQKGWRVILTRYKDRDVTYPGSPDKDELQARSDVANKNNASLFISIHCNASTKADKKGSSYHWFKSSDKPLAQALKGCLGANIGTIDKGLFKDQFYVLNHSKVPSVLVEVAFMSNKDDIKILASPRSRQKIAFQMAKSVNYFLYNKNLVQKGIKAGE